METKSHILLVALKAPMLKTPIAIVKKKESHLMQDPTTCVSSANEGKTQVG
jgi:hypothetical protein